MAIHGTCGKTIPGDHTNGRTCYEQVTSLASLDRITFEDAIKKIQEKTR